MAIKDVMLVLRTYPTPTTKDFIVSAVGLAAILDCRISAFAPEVLIRVPSTLLGNALIDVSGMAACEMNKSTQMQPPLRSSAANWRISMDCPTS